MDEHEKIKAQVLAAMYKEAGISQSAPINPDLKNDLEIAAIMLIRASKRPLDPKKIAKHVETIKRRHANRERDACLLPSIFQKTQEQQQRLKKNNAAVAVNPDEGDEHYGRAAVHHDRIQRESVWASHVRKEVEEQAREETEQRLKTEHEKRERLLWLKQQVDEDQKKKQGERQEMKDYMDKLLDQSKSVLVKEDQREVEKKTRRAKDRKENDDYLRSVRERKASEKVKKEEQERALLKAIREQEEADAQADLKKKRERMTEMKTFLETNRQQEADHRDEMIRTRLEEMRNASTQGIWFDGAERRAARVSARVQQQDKAYHHWEKGTGADMTRVQNQRRLYKHLEDLGEEEGKKIQEAEHLEKEKRREQQEKLRRELDEQIHSDAARRKQAKEQEIKKWGATGGSVILLDRAIDGDHKEAQRKSKGNKMREELKQQAVSQRRLRRQEVTGKI